MVVTFLRMVLKLKHRHRHHNQNKKCITCIPFFYVYASSPAQPEVAPDTSGDSSLVPDGPLYSPNDLGAHFSSIDHKNCDDIVTLQAFAAHQRQKDHTPHPFYPTTMFPKDLCAETSPDFKKIWGREDKYIKAKLIKLAQDDSSRLSADTSTAVVPWKLSSPRSANFMELSKGPITPDVFHTFHADTSINSVQELQAFSSQVVAYHQHQDKLFVLDINNVTSKKLEKPISIRQPI